MSLLPLFGDTPPIAPSRSYYFEIYDSLSHDSRVVATQNNIKDIRNDLEEEIQKLKILRIKYA